MMFDCVKRNDNEEEARSILNEHSNQEKAE